MRKISWQAKLIAAFTLVLIASFLFHLFYILPHFNEHERLHAEQYIVQAVNSIAYELSADIRQISSIVPNIARRPEFRSMDKERIRQLMDQPPENWSGLQEILVADTDGDVLFPDVDNSISPTAEPFAETDLFTLPVTEGSRYIGAPRYDPATKTVNIRVSTRIATRRRGTLGVLVGTVRLNDLIDRLADYPLLSGYAAYLLLPDGTVIAHSGKDLFALKEGPLSIKYDDLARANLGEGNGAITAYDRNGERGMRACLPLRFNNWRLVVEAPMHSIMATSKSLSKRLLAAYIGFFVLALAISVFFSRRLANQRDHVEAALRAREERFRGMFHNMSTGGQILESLPSGSDFIIKDINRAAARIAKTPAEEMIGKRYAEVFPEHARLEFFKRIQETWRTGEPAQSSAIIHSEGKLTSWEECYIYKLPTGELVILIDDVTEQKRSADALQEAETRYTELVRNANTIILRLSGAGKITFINEFAQRFFGYSEEEIVGQSILGTLLPETDSMGNDLRAMLSDVMAHPERFTTNENENMRKNGERVWVSWTNKSLHARDGQLTEYFCVGTDITERRRAEAAMRTRLRYEEGLAACSRTLLAQTPGSLEETLHHLLKAADVSRVCLFENIEDPDDGIAMHQQIEVCAPNVPPSVNHPDPDPLPYKKGMMRWAEAFEKNEPIVGLVEDFPQPERGLLEWQNILSILAIRIWVDDEWYGFITFDHTTERRLWNDEDILLLQAAADIIGIYLEHQRTEAALRESELRYRAIFEQSAAAIMLVDAETGDVIESNAKAHDLLGRSSEGQGALRMAHLQGANPEDDVAKHMAAVMASGEKLSESRLRTKDGRMRDVLLDCKALKVDGRDMLQTVWFDISDRKKAERDLEKSHEELRKLTARLQDIREEECSRISREIHDELGQGLTGLNLNLAWLQKQLPAVCSPKRIAELSEKVNLMTDLVHTAIRKIQQIATDLRPSALDLGLIEAVEWEVEQFREQTGLPCDLSITGANVVLGDDSSIAIYRILQESLTNVARHAEASHVWVSLKSEANSLALQVTDNGCGCDDAGLTEGQSLGIRGMRERAHSVSGKIAVVGVPGEGTSVHVTIPHGGRDGPDPSPGKMPDNPRA